MKNVFSILAAAVLTLGLFSYGTENLVDTEAPLQTLQTNVVNPSPDCPVGSSCPPPFIAEAINPGPCGPGGDDCPFVAEQIAEAVNPSSEDGPCPGYPGDICPFTAEQMS